MRGGPPAAPPWGNGGCVTLGFCQVRTHLQAGKWANNSAGNGPRGWTGLRVMSLNMSNAAPVLGARISFFSTAPRFGQTSPLEILVASHLSVLSWTICPPSVIVQSFANSSAFSFPLMTNCSKSDISRFLSRKQFALTCLTSSEIPADFLRNLYHRVRFFRFWANAFHLSLLESQSMTTCSVVDPHILLRRQRKAVSSAVLMVCCISFLSSIVP